MLGEAKLLIDKNNLSKFSVNPLFDFYIRNFSLLASWANWAD